MSRTIKRLKLDITLYSDEGGSATVSDLFVIRALTRKLGVETDETLYVEGTHGITYAYRIFVVEEAQ